MSGSLSHNVASFANAMEAVQLHSDRANHRYDLLMATAKANKSPPGDAAAAAAYDKAFAECVQPGDLEPYTEACLDAHTAAMQSLSGFLYELTTTLADLNPGDLRHDAAGSCCRSACTLYADAADAYEKASNCACLDALQGSLQLTRDEFRLMRLEAAASVAKGPAADSAKARVISFQAKISKDRHDNRLLEEKAELVKTKAKTYSELAVTASALVEKLCRQ